jgi:cysteine desulfurase
MLPYFTEDFGNPASTIHAAGRTASEAVEKAREQMAALIGARRGEIIFPSGATESNNLALAGVARATSGMRKRIVTTAIEHKSVLMLGRELTKQGFDIVVLPVDREGRVSIDTAHEVINDDTLLVSVQAANNEVGTIQHEVEIAEIAHARGALMHCDAAQAVGKIPVDVEEWDADFLSISAHKLYGPKGVGALYVKNGPYGQPLVPLVWGGGQEGGLRSGTLNVPGIVGLGVACELCQELMSEESICIGRMRDSLEQRLIEAIPEVKRNGDLAERLPNNSSLTLPGVDAEALIANLPGLALSTGSACMAGAPEPSHVLLALGLSRDEAYATLRVGLGRFSTTEEVARSANAIVGAYEQLTRMVV